MESYVRSYFIAAPFCGLAALAVLACPAEVRAQSVFCPSAIPFLQNGACTNFTNGAYSGAAVASQALSELSQTTTQQTTTSASEAVTTRRDQEEERCAEGFRRVDGTCEPIAKPVPRERPVQAAAPALSAAEAEKPKGKKVRAAAKRRPAIAPKAPEVAQPGPPPPSMLMPVPVEPAILPAPPPIAPGVRYASWGQVYGDYEKRNAAGTSGLFQSSGAPIGVANVTIDNRTGTVGFLAGADVTTRGALFAYDGVVAGVMAGYISSNLVLNATNLQINAPTQPSALGIGSSRTNVNLSGATAGLYATYFNGAFSADAAVRVDAFTLNQTFTEGSACSCGVLFLVAGNGSVSLVNGTVSGNLNYRFNIYPNFWIEPTVGAVYTNSSYGGGAAQLGLDDGNLVRMQGGARFGTTALFDNHILMTATATGLAYDDVLVSGGFIPTAASGAQNLLVKADQGFVRGLGILALNLDYGNGLSSFIQGDVYGGAHLFGAGGKAGIRYQW